MVFGQNHSIPAPAKNASGVAAVSNKIKLVGHQDYIGGGSAQIAYFGTDRMVTTLVAMFILLLFNLFEFGLAFGADDHLVEKFESQL